MLHSMSRRKILIAYYGLPRATAICLPSLRRHIVDVLGNRGVELTETGLLIFQQAVANPRSGENAQLALENYQLFDGVAEPFTVDENLHREYFDALKTYGDTWRDGFSSLGNVLRQLLCLQTLGEHIAGMDFDQLILVRADLFCHRDLNEREIGLILGAPDQLVVPTWGSHKGVNDRFMVCPARYSRVITNRLVRAKAYCEAVEAFHSERFLRWVIEAEEIPVKTISLPMSRVRLGGVIRQERFKPHNVSEPRRLLNTMVHRRLPSRWTYGMGWYY